MVSTLAHVRSPPIAAASPLPALRAIVRWYNRFVYRKLEGPDTVPFYCDRGRVGHFAVSSEALALGDDAAIWQVFVLLMLFQSRRDVDVFAIARSMAKRDVLAITALPGRLSQLVAHPCQHLQGAPAFDSGCDVLRSSAGRYSCNTLPHVPCVVKSTAGAIGRMAKLGKLPVSAALHLRDDARHDLPLASGPMASARTYAARGRDGTVTPTISLNAVAARAERCHLDIAARTVAVVAALQEIFHVGEKLATMFVSQLATPALAPDATPWFPLLDGNHLLVLDANVTRLVRQLALTSRGRRSRERTAYSANVSPSRVPRFAFGSYAETAQWLYVQAARLDVGRLLDIPVARSPRMVQQAMYWYGSRSNRVAYGLGCDAQTCVPGLCPMHG